MEGKSGNAEDVDTDINGAHPSVTTEQSGEAVGKRGGEAPWIGTAEARWEATLAHETPRIGSAETSGKAMHLHASPWDHRNTVEGKLHWMRR